MSNPVAFAQSAARLESMGWHMGLIPSNPLKAPDPYVCLALAAQTTEHLALGTLLDTPVLRHPSVLAGSICTVAGLAPGRVHLGLGIGDTAVRFNGLAPATMKQLEATAVHTKALMAGERVPVGAVKPARLNHAVPVPLWIAAQGPKTLQMAGRVADGVWLRVGTHPANLQRSWDAVCTGAKQAGRAISEIQLGLIFHTAYHQDPDAAKLMGKAMAAGYYEYSPMLFDQPGFSWRGTDPRDLRTQAYPDFHHHRDPIAAGRLVDFLDDSVASAFSLHGDWVAIQQQMQRVLELGLPVSVVLPHPVLALGETLDFAQEFASQVMPALR